MEILKILNSKPIQENFLGFNGIYHGYAGMGDDCGRILDEELCELEADRAKDQNLKIARTFYDWVSWDKEKNEWDWNSHDFEAFCNWVRRMKVRGIDVALNPASVTDIMSQGWRGKSPFTVEGDWKASIDNYTAWVSETLRQIIDVRGLTNLKYLLYFTEPQHYGNSPIPNGLKDPYDVWYQFSKALEERLKTDVWYDRITVVGPQEGGTDDAQMMKWVYENHPHMVAAYSSHNYSRLILPKEYFDIYGRDVVLLGVAGARSYCEVDLKPNTEYLLRFSAELQTEDIKKISGYLLAGAFKENGTGCFTSGGSATDRLGRYSTAMLEGARLPEKLEEISIEFTTPEDTSKALLGFFADLKPDSFLLFLSRFSLQEKNDPSTKIENLKFDIFPKDQSSCGGVYNFFDKDFKDKRAYIGNEPKLWYDEYNCLGYRINEDIVKRPEHPLHGTDLAAARIAFLNNGVQNSFMWSLFDQQWPYNHTNNDDDFVDGDHRCGVMPSLIRSKIPYPAYFAMRITALVNGDENSKIFKGVSDGDVQGAMVENSDGNITVLLLNERSKPKDFEIIFETPVSLDLNAYVYNPETVVCSEEIPPLKADFKVKGVTQSIKGTIPPGGVMAYSTK